MHHQLNDLFSQSEDYFTQSIARRTQDFNGAASAYSSDINDNPLNTLVIRKNIPSLDELIKDATDFFAITNTPWCIVMRAELVNQESVATLHRWSFSESDISVAMVLDLSTINLHADNSTVKNMDAQLDSWAIPLQAYPATSKSVALQYAQSHKLALERKRNMNHLSLFNGDEVISSMTLSWKDGWSRIDDVATLPEHQCQGFATKLMHHGLCLAAKKGAQFCFLEASPAGLTIYQKLGFQELFKNQVFIKEWK